MSVSPSLEEYLLSVIRQYHEEGHACDECAPSYEAYERDHIRPEDCPLYAQTLESRRG